jgi:hypothetical protein
MRVGTVLLALTALAVAVSSLPASDVPNELTDLDAMTNIEDGAVALVQEAKMAWGMDDVESPNIHTKKPWSAQVSKAGDLGESMGDVPVAGAPQSTANAAGTPAAIGMYDVKFSVIAWKGDEVNGVIAKMRMTAKELPSGPDDANAPWYEVEIGSKNTAGQRQACIQVAKDKKACAPLDGKDMSLFNWPTVDGVAPDQCTGEKLWASRDTDTTNFLLRMKDNRLTLYALSGSAPGGKVEIVNKMLGAAPNSYHHISVATNEMGDHDARTGVWVVCAKECTRKIITSPKGSESTNGAFVTAGSVEDAFLQTNHWRSEFFPEIQRPAGKFCKATGQGSDGNGLTRMASALQHMSCRPPWHKIPVNVLSFSAPADMVWRILDQFKYANGEKLNTEEDPDEIYKFNFGAQFSGAVLIPTTAKYIFYLHADGANAQLTVDDGTETIPDGNTGNNNPTNVDEATWMSKEMELQNGQRNFKVSYFQKVGPSTLWVMWTKATGIEPTGKCGKALSQVSPQDCSMSFIALPVLAGGPIGPTDFSACGEDSGAFTVKAWKNVMESTNVADAMAKTRKSPDSIFLANSIYFENTAGNFDGLDSGFTNNFVLRADGFFKAKDTGKYKFWLVADDGAQMWIDHRTFLNKDIPLTVDNDGKHLMKGMEPYPECATCQEEVELAEGYWRMSVVMFDTYQVGSSQPKTSALEIFVQTPEDSGPRLINCDDVTHSPISQTAKYAYEGCYYDDFCGSSTGKNRKGGTQVPLKKCYELCAGYQYFGRQGKGECWCGGKPMAKGGAEEFGKGTALLDTGTGDPQVSAEPVKPSGCMCDKAEWGMCNQCVYKRIEQGVKDIALGKSAECSKCDTAMGAWRALDGFTNHGIFTNDGTVSKATRSAACAWVTDPPEGKADQPSWWRVDMGGSQRVDGFSVTGVAESKFRDESIDWTAKVGDWLAEGTKDAVCAEQVSGYKGTNYYPCTVKGLQGRYFSLFSGPATTKMIICEVQVWGDAQDLASGKFVEQISTSKTMEGCSGSENPNGCLAKRAVDGDPSTDMTGRTCTATDPSENPAPPWWKVDLKSPAAVESVTVYMPKDGIPERASQESIQFEVRVGDDAKDYTKNAKCGDMFMMEPDETMKIIDCGKKVGQYVFVDIPFENKVLSLCEVRVTGAHVVEDIAGNKPCGSNSNPAACTYALDSQTNDAKCSTTIAGSGEQAWWYVDLQEDYFVSKVDVWGKMSQGRLDALSNFQVRVGDTKPGAQTLDKNRACESAVNDGKIAFESFNRNPTESEPTASVPCAREPGSYVSINIPEQEKAQLDLCEVKVYGQIRSRNKINLAEGKTATQIDTAYGGVAGRAVDGDTETSFGKESCTHTNKKLNPWWKVDLTKVAEIHRVIVWNRSDCCAANLNNFEVRVGDNEDVFKNMVCGGKNAIDPASTAPRVVNCEKKLGRYVSIDLQDEEQYLNLCEVKVQGEWADAGLQSEKGDKTGQSSTDQSGYAKRAVDGNTGPEWNKNTCTMTQKEEDPYWWINLEKEAAISKVTVWNRGDCCGERLRNFEVRVGDNDPSGGGYASNPACGTTHWGDAQDTGGGDHSVDCDEITGKYVTIVLPGKNKILTLCEVRINGAFTTKALGKCKGAVETMEADMAKVKEELEAERKKSEAALKNGGANGQTVADNNEAIENVEEQVDAATEDTGTAAGVDMKDYMKKEEHDEKMAQSKKDLDSTLQKLTTAEAEVESNEKKHKAAKGDLNKCTTQQKADADKFEDLEASKDAAAKKCVAEATKIEEDNKKALSASRDKLTEEKKAHGVTRASSEANMQALKAKCLQDESQARDDGKQEGLKACPGVNGLMREIWRLRQKLGAADAGGE